MRTRPPIAAPALLAAALLAVTLPVAPAAAETLHEEFSRTFPLEPGAEVTVSNINGSLEFSSWDRNEAQVEAVKIVKTMGRDRAEAAIEELRIEVEHTPRSLSIETRHPSHKSRLGWILGRNVQAKVSYRITLPREVSLRARTVNGNVVVAAVSGHIDAETTNGQIEIVEAAGRARAQSMNGSIRADFRALDTEGDCLFQTTNGGITVSVPASLQADIAATTVNGAVDTDFSVLVEGGTSYRRKTLKGEINGGGGQLTLTTVNGSIHLRKRPDESAEARGSEDRG